MDQIRSVDLIKRIERGGWFYDGTMLMQSHFESQEAYYLEFASKFMRDTGLNKKKESPTTCLLDNSIDSFIQSYGWTIWIELCEKDLVFDQKKKVIFIPSRIYETGMSFVAAGYAAVGVFYLENTQQGRSILQDENARIFIDSLDICDKDRGHSSARRTVEILAGGKNSILYPTKHEHQRESLPRRFLKILGGI